MLRTLVLTLLIQNTFATIPNQLQGTWSGVRHKKVLQNDGSIKHIEEKVDGVINPVSIELNYTEDNGDKYFVTDFLTEDVKNLGSYTFERNYNDTFAGSGEGYCDSDHCSFAIIGTNHAAGSADYFQTISLMGPLELQIKGFRYQNKKIIYHWSATLKKACVPYGYNQLDGFSCQY